MKFGAKLKIHLTQKFNNIPVYDRKDIKTKVKDNTFKFIVHVS